MNARDSLNYDLAEIECAKQAFITVRIAELTRELYGEGLIDADIAKMAEEEWEPLLLASAPSCWSCEYIGPEMLDPYGTGDSPTMRECQVPSGECPWGKR